MKEDATYDIAIIGMSGRFPRASTVSELWTNLSQGVDCITELPEEKWRGHYAYSADRHARGRIYAKWGGFIDDVDKFDPLFFGISPREAERMDPQERLFLQTAWHAIEDAGYAPDTMMAERVGVFVGVMWGQYQLFGIEETLRGNPVSLSSSFASIANRVSHICNFRGPSVAVDTMCSSSLTALHLACQSMQNGECNWAIAGGVNLSLHLDKYLSICQGEFAATDGRCRAFGEGGNGYVPGEGVAAILLKSLPRAMEDDDHVYAVIKATSISHAGRTNGYTVPDPTAQELLITETLLKADINPETISYVEAHGTGTALGDPIEIAGLARAFRRFTDKRQYCAIGSVKSNIGHLEAAAGIAGLVKVLLQMHNRQLAPSLHSARLNPYIDFADSPFFVPQELMSWETDGSPSAGLPRRAAISAFGAGGSNAHVILEELVRADRRDDAACLGVDRLVLLSAKDEERLRDHAQTYLEYLSRASVGVCLRDLAYTLQIGRQHLEERMAIICKDTKSLREALVQYGSGVVSGPNLLTGRARARRKKQALKISPSDEIESFVRSRDLRSLARLWLEGTAIDWYGLHEGERVRRVSLPGYPFAKETYWAPQEAVLRHGSAITTGLLSADSSHARRFSEPGAMTYSLQLHREEYLLKEHRVNGQEMLPGAVYIEAARAAGEACTQRRVRAVRNIVWEKPIIAAAGREVLISVAPTESGARFVFHSLIGQEEVEYSRGELDFSTEDYPTCPRYRLDEMASRLENLLSGDDCYRILAASGMDYGLGCRNIRRIVFKDNEALAYLELDPRYNLSPSKYYINPLILDSAFQATIALTDESVSALLIPYQASEVVIRESLQDRCYAHIQRASEREGEHTFHISILSEGGQELARINGFRLLAARFDASTNASKEEAVGTTYFGSQWESANSVTDLLGFGGRDILVLNADEEDRASLAGLEGIGAHPLFLDASGLAATRSTQDGETGSWIEDGVTELLSTSRSLVASPFRVVHIIHDTHEQSLAQRLHEDLLSIFCVARAFARCQISALEWLFVYRRSEPGEFPSSLGDCLFGAIAGFNRSLSLECPQFALKSVVVDESVELVATIAAEFSCFDFPEVKYESGKRFSRVAKELLLEKHDAHCSNNNGAIVILGGLGGIGLVLAEHFAQKPEAKLVLVGRRELGANEARQLEHLRNRHNCPVEYYRADITDRVSIDELVRYTKTRFGKLRGLIHCAGLLNDSLVRNKHLAATEQVLRTKILSTSLLHEALVHDDLDFFIIFSSIASILGNIGQTDYAMANRFLDCLAEYRSGLRKTNKRMSRMTSIDWPLWEDTGMRIPESKRQHLHAQTGFLPIPVGTAVQTLEHCLATAEPHIIVGYGETSRVKATVEGSFVCKRDDRQADTPLPNTPVSRSVMKRTVLQYLRSLLAEEIKLPEERIDASCSLGRYGVDSVIIMSMNASLETHIPSLPKSLFYEHDSLDELAEYFVTNHPRWITRHFGLEDRTAVAGTETSPEQETHGLGTPRASGGPADIAQERTQDANGGNDIAIIGVSGRYPMANDLHEFWGNLKEGKDCIREIPPERWHGWDYYSAHKGKVGKSYSVWGGFIDDVDKFDSLFFRISPDEAMLMDPQERIFLETAWHTVEDAGYRVDSVAKAKVGVFVGVMWGQYQFFGVEGMAKGKYVFPSSSFSSIANRVSFCLNFRGPSLAVDTMCSSSLTALHLACESLRRGESEYALVGGVNLSLHPFKYLALGDSGLLSTNGQCRAFGKDGDGYVPGEGVGSVLLKPLWKSIEDNDNIYAVIKATAVNHGGQTSGYTVPSPNAQAALISEALQGAGIDPGSIGYVEAHGAGTALGDPIEIAGLQKSLGKGLQNLVCPIGSVKTNIGHLEAAAGIAGLTKVLLQLQHKQLVPSLHAQQLNPNIDFASVPFRVQQVLETFTAPSATEGKEPSPPRRACISSFGAGGANAHVIVEEYERRGRRSMPTGSSSEGLILLSAKSKEQLIKYAARLRSYVRAACEPADSDGGASGQVRKQCADQDLASIAYTLQAGRMPMEHRVAIVAEDLRELLDKLNGFCEQIPDARDVYQGNVTEEKNRLKGLVDGTEGDEFARLLLRSRNIRKLAELWVAGVDLDWDLLYPDRRPRRLSLPTYPFAKVSHWLCREGGTTPGREGEVSTVPRVRHEEHRGPEPAKRRATGEEGERTLAALEEAITGKIARLLKMDREQIDVGTAVSALGFSSIYALRLLNLVNDEYGQQIALKEVAFSPYLAIRDLTRAIARLVTGRRDDHSVAPNGARHTHGRRVEVTYRYDDLFPEVQDLSSSLTTHSILLTGATGILGGRLLKDLLETTKSDVFCLIRDVSLEAARIRAKAMLRVHDPQGRLEREFDTRVRPILGDISADELGLSPHHRAELADRIDLVLHCAAKASLTGRYEEVAATNVDGTAHIAEFALQTRQRYCVLISTHMVMGDRWMKDCAPFAERDLMLGQSFEDMGYQRSKYEAEIITRLSHREGLRWVIVRSGNIMGDSTSGYYPVAVNNVESFFYDMIRTIIQTQYAVETPLYFDITPIDYVSKGILHLCLERRHVYETYHLTNPHHRRTSDVYDLIRQCGYEFTVLDHASYAEAIRKISNDLDTESSILLELTRFNPLFRNRPTGSSYADNQYTTKLLEAAEITCHEVDYELMKVYLDYCTEIGYIGRPGTVS